MRVRMGKRGMGGGTILVVLAALYFGVDPSVFLGTGGMAPVPLDTRSSPQDQSRAFRSAAEDQLAACDTFSADRL
jgi:predicted metalloprotease